MYSVRNIDEFFNELAPSSLSEAWDNDGVMLCGKRDGEVKKILIALEIRMKTVEYAVKNGFELIVTHHPFIFKKLSRVCDGDFEVLHKLMENNVSVLSYHTRLDSAAGGVNDALASTLGLEDVSSFGGDNGMSGRIGILPEPLKGEEFAQLLKEKLGCDVRCVFGSGMIKKVAVVGGAGKDFALEAFVAGADAFVTGEVPHHMFADAEDKNLSVYECGHYYTENPVCNTIKKLIDQKFDGIYTEIFDVNCPYTCIH